MEQTWITITEASKLVGLTNSGFHSQLVEEYKKESEGTNTMLWKRVGYRVMIEKQSVLDYFEKKRR